MKRLINSILIFTLFVITPANKPIQANSICHVVDQASLDLKIDGVVLQGCLPFYPDSQWFQPSTSSPVQSAYTADTGYSFSITAIPFGIRSPTEIFPVIETSSTETNLLAILQKARQAQGAKTRVGPTAYLFDHEVASLISVHILPDINLSKHASQITEWLALAGKRLWIVRALQVTDDQNYAPTVSGDLLIKSDNLETPSISSSAHLPSKQPTGLNAQSVNTTPSPTLYYLPNPSWWNGDCDINHYQSDSYMNPYRIASYPLGTSYRNVPACGPLPGWWNPDVMVYFYKDAFPVYEFECVELVLRFMYQAYGVAPYMANGNGIVSNYTGSSLVTIANHTIGKAPQPGDIMSYCGGCTYGHTSVVISSNVNSSGNGSVVVMEQNWTAQGQTTLQVSNWTLIGDAGWIYAWLHPVSLNIITPTATSTFTPTCTLVPTPYFTVTPDSTPTPGTPAANLIHLFLPIAHSRGC